MGTSDPKTVELAVRIVSYLAYSSLHLLLNHADDPDPGPDNEFNQIGRFTDKAVYYRIQWRELYTQYHTYLCQN